MKNQTQSGQPRRWVHHDPLMGFPLIAIGVVFFLVAMLVPYCAILGVPAALIAFIGVVCLIPERGSKCS